VTGVRKLPGRGGGGGGGGRESKSVGNSLKLADYYNFVVHQSNYCKGDEERFPQSTSLNN